METLAKAFVAVLHQDKVIDAMLRQERIRRVLRHSFTENMAHFLQSPEGHKLFWIKANVRPLAPDTHWAAIPNSIRERRMREATREAAGFVHEHIPHLEGTHSPYATLEEALDAVTVSGLYLEFGVFSGTTINHIAEYVGPETVVHGFDSFQGLPEAWGPAGKGTFDRDGVAPDVRDNVRLHPGWFSESIDRFLAGHEGPSAFIHCDADLYSSTRTILTKMRSRIISGTVIVFDEYINYPNWREHEYRAFSEFIDLTGHEFEYIAYTDRRYSVAVRIL